MSLNVLYPGSGFKDPVSSTFRSEKNQFQKFPVSYSKIFKDSTLFTSVCCRHNDRRILTTHPPLHQHPQQLTGQRSWLQQLRTTCRKKKSSSFNGQNTNTSSVQSSSSSSPLGGAAGITCRTCWESRTQSDIKH